MARLVCALGLPLTILAAGCWGGDGGRATTLLVAGDPAEIEAFRRVARAYERETPGARVRLIEASDRADLVARLSTSLAGGSPPDVFVINYRYYGLFAAKGAIEPVEDRMNGSDAFEPSDFYSPPLEAFRWQGRQLCMPLNVSGLVVYFNRDLFRRAGVPEPRAGWSFNDFLGAATRLTMDANGQAIVPGDPDAGGAKAVVHGVGVEPSLIRLAPFVWSNGGELVDDDVRPTRLTLDSGSALQALQAFLLLRPVTPSDVEVEAEDNESRFANGRLAMFLSSRRSTPTFRTIRDFDWDVAPLPVLQEEAGILHSDGFCITAASENKEDAWRFVELAVSETGQRIAARTGRTVPSLRVVARSRAFLDPSQKPSNSKIFLDGIPAIRRVPSISTWPEIEDIAEPILENGLYLGWPPDRVAREVDEATRRLFERAQGP